MTFYFGALTALCAAYWVLLLMYSGFLVQQHWIWLFFAAFFLLNAAAAWGYRRGLRTTPLWLVTALHTTAFAGLAVMIAAGILIATGMTREEVRNPEFCIVLGASIREDGSLSPSLKRRLDETIRFSDRNPATRFVLSGGQGPREPVTEAEAMGSYLVYNGVPEDRLLLEIQSKNTYENILYSDALISRILEEEKKRTQPGSEEGAGGIFIHSGGGASGPGGDPQRGLSSVPGPAHGGKNDRRRILRHRSKKRSGDVCPLCDERVHRHRER